MRTRRRVLFSLMVIISTLGICNYILLQKVLQVHRDTPPLTITFSAIPKIIHQFWNDDVIPTEFVDKVKGLVVHNSPPDWQYYFWTLDTSRSFIREKYPQFISTWDNYPDMLSLTDAIRYLAIYEYGGFYFDLDTASVKPLDSFLKNHSCAFVPEPDEHFPISSFLNQRILSTASLSCKRKHPMYRFIIDSLPEYLRQGCTNGHSCTGPKILTRIYQNASRELRDTTQYVSSEYFQDVYDQHDLSETVRKNCSSVDSMDKTSLIFKACSTWISRGKDARKLSPKAYTYHTWYHVTRLTRDKYNNKTERARMNVSFKPDNNITLVVNHAKMYKTSGGFQ